jgi:hypothetical protein
MADVVVQETAWRHGYEAALRDLEQHVAKHHPAADTALLARILAELRAGLITAHRADPLAAETASIPSEELEREWTAG